MYEPLRRRTLALLKVPHQPHPPLGDPASLRVFHAGLNYFRLRLAAWAVAQLIALAGIIFWTTMLFEVESIARAEQTAPVAAPLATAAGPIEPGKSANPAGVPSTVNQPPRNPVERFAERMRTAAATAERAGAKAEKSGRSKIWAGYKQMLVEIGLLLPAWAFPLVWGLKILGLVIYLIQLPLTYAVRRLDYEMRWYMVTDRSLRIRHGIWKVSEATMSFANLQQVEVAQGPVQRLLGLADVKVQSAGGGGGDKPHEHGEDMHLGLFHSVTNAPEIRDLILERLRRFRETGLGDPDESTRPAPVASANEPADTLAAAQELLAEARALRAALT